MPGVKVRLQEAQRHSCTISSFFLRMPRRRQRAAAAVWARFRLFGSERDAGAFGNDGHSARKPLPYHEPHENRKGSTRNLEAEGLMGLRVRRVVRRRC